VGERRLADGQTPVVPRLVAALTVLAALAVAAGGWSWAEREPAPQPRARSADMPGNGLTYDQATCLQFGLILKRTEAVIPAVSLLGIDPTARDFGSRLPAEVAALDAVARDNPRADYRLVDIVARVADASALVLGHGSRLPLQDRVVLRADAANAAHSACRTMADFDSRQLEPTDVGR